MAIRDDNRVYIENKAIFVDNCPLIINNSKMFFNADAHKDKTFNFEVFTKDFEVQNIITEFESTLDMDAGGEFAKNLFNLFFFFVLSKIFPI